LVKHKPTLRRKKEGVKRIARPAVEIVSLEMTMKSVWAACSIFEELEGVSSRFYEL